MFNFNHVSATKTAAFKGNVHAHQQVVCGTTFRLVSKANDHFSVASITELVGRFKQMIALGYQVDSSRSTGFAVGKLHGNFIISLYKAEMNSAGDRVLTSVSITTVWEELSVEDEKVFLTLKDYLRM